MPTLDFYLILKLIAKVIKASSLGNHNKSTFDLKRKSMPGILYTLIGDST